eukprot:2237376-Amphidinium_carterae.1
MDPKGEIATLCVLTPLRMLLTNELDKGSGEGPRFLTQTKRISQKEEQPLPLQPKDYTIRLRSTCSKLCRFHGSFLHSR